MTPRTWSLLTLAFLLLAGCVERPADDAIEAASTDATAPMREIVGGVVEGVLWLPPSEGQDRKETLVELPANFSGMLVVGEVSLGARYGPFEVPLQTSDVLVELRGPNGDVLADAHLGMQETSTTLETTTLEDGAHTLAILSYGGSDGEANGDYVAYRVETKAP